MGPKKTYKTPETVHSTPSPTKQAPPRYPTPQSKPNVTKHVAASKHQPDPSERRPFKRAPRPAETVEPSQLRKRSRVEHRDQAAQSDDAAPPVSQPKATKTAKDKAVKAVKIEAVTTRKPGRRASDGVTFPRRFAQAEPEAKSPKPVAASAPTRPKRETDHAPTRPKRANDGEHTAAPTKKKQKSARALTVSESDQAAYLNVPEVRVVDLLAPPTDDAYAASLAQTHERAQRPWPLCNTGRHFVTGDCSMRQRFPPAYPVSAYQARPDLLGDRHTNFDVDAAFPLLPRRSHVVDEQCNGLGYQTYLCELYWLYGRLRQKKHLHFDGLAAGMAMLCKNRPEFWFPTTAGLEVNTATRLTPGQAAAARGCQFLLLPILRRGRTAATNHWYAAIVRMGKRPIVYWSDTQQSPSRDETTALLDQLEDAGLLKASACKHLLLPTASQVADWECGLLVLEFFRLFVYAKADGTPQTWDEYRAPFRIAGYGDLADASDADRLYWLRWLYMGWISNELGHPRMTDVTAVPERGGEPVLGPTATMQYVGPTALLKTLVHLIGTPIPKQ